MKPTHDDDRPQTEADHTSETRFGPRPVPQGHRVPHGAPQPRRVIPSGDASSDGRSAHPYSSTGAKIAVWGGIGLGVAGGTAAAVLAIRKIAEALSDDPRPLSSTRHHAAPSSAPRFARLDEDEREAMRRRVRAQDREDREEIARLRAEASQARSTAAPRIKRKKANFAESLIDTSTRLSQSLEGVAKSMALAVESFRGVATQATGIVQEFAGTAEQLRAALRGEPVSDTRRTKDDERTHRL
ncbi:hypothetical protein [Paracoccus aerius]|uniref:Uncharacterized protein n=1 Tax=Paracoccus aerius TaxID=1915382 RepID=A0ABS1S9I0_9RHOB|nr:hypothetical protein [Paracoccus aerius]MBL3674362.1 hypothetical protein [Paracoccus aerius]GHG25072.1 hypothetical protein GCM10017322_24030 [Paracoccus aerius]